MIFEADVNLSSVMKKVKKKKRDFHPGCELLYMFTVWGEFLYQNALRY